LRFISLTQCGLTSLNGIATISRNIEELYLAFNHISDVANLMGMDRLRVLDLEASEIANLSNLRYLTCCPALTAPTLAGNPGAADNAQYAKTVAECVPNLIYLDEKRIRPKKADLLVRPPVQPRTSGQRKSSMQITKSSPRNCRIISTTDRRQPAATSGSPSEERSLRQHQQRS
jgi:Leucine-rich repeat (LRR) protein